MPFQNILKNQHLNIDVSSLGLGFFACTQFCIVATLIFFKLYEVRGRETNKKKICQLKFEVVKANSDTETTAEMSLLEGFWVKNFSCARGKGKLPKT